MAPTALARVVAHGLGSVVAASDEHTEREEESRAELACRTSPNGERSTKFRHGLDSDQMESSGAPICTRQLGRRLTIM